MALIKAKARQTTAVERVSEGADVYLRALRDGSLSVADFLAVMSLEGRAYQFEVGTFTTPITFTAGAIVGTTPNVAAVVPAGVVVIPVEISLQIESIGTALILEIAAVAGQNGSVTTAGTAVTTKSNLRMDAPFASSLAPTYNSITAVIPTVNRLEFWRDGEISAVDQTHSATVSVYDHAHKYEWSALKSGVFPILTPASTLMLYVSTQAGTGFWKVKYIELPVTSVT